MRRALGKLKPVRPQWAAAPQSALRAQERHASHRKSCRSARQHCWSPPLTSPPWTCAAPPCLRPLSHQQCYRWERGFILISYWNQFYWGKDIFKQNLYTNTQQYKSEVSNSLWFLNNKWVKYVVLVYKQYEPLKYANCILSVLASSSYILKEIK